MLSGDAVIWSIFAFRQISHIRLCLSKVLDDFTDHEPNNILIFIIDVLFWRFKFRGRYNTSCLAIVAIVRMK